jgi:hypothetical protein
MSYRLTYNYDFNTALTFYDYGLFGNFKKRALHDYGKLADILNTKIGYGDIVLLIYFILNYFAAKFI